MKKGEIIGHAIELSIDNFRSLYNKTDDKEHLEVKGSNIDILGFKEDDEHNKYIMIFSTPKMPDHLCHVTYNLHSQKFRTRVYKNIKK